MAAFHGEGFAIEAVWKETVWYSEDDRRHAFDAGWGVDPPVLYVPTAEVWDRHTPEWMHGRHDVVVARLVAHSGHRVVESPTG